MGISATLKPSIFKNWLTGDLHQNSITLKPLNVDASKDLVPMSRGESSVLLNRLLKPTIRKTNDGTSYEAIVAQKMVNRLGKRPQLLFQQVVRDLMDQKDIPGLRKQSTDEENCEYLVEDEKFFLPALRGKLLRRKLLFLPKGMIISNWDIDDRAGEINEGTQLWVVTKGVVTEFGGYYFPEGTRIWLYDGEMISAGFKKGRDGNFPFMGLRYSGNDDVGFCDDDGGRGSEYLKNFMLKPGEWEAILRSDMATKIGEYVFAPDSVMVRYPDGSIRYGQLESGDFVEFGKGELTVF